MNITKSCWHHFEFIERQLPVPARALKVNKRLEILSGYWCAHTQQERVYFSLVVSSENIIH